MSTCLALVVSLALAGAPVFLASAELIKTVPGLNGNTAPFDMYSGYVTVNASSNRNLFYWCVVNWDASVLKEGECREAVTPWHFTECSFIYRLAVYDPKPWQGTFYPHRGSFQWKVSLVTCAY